MKKLLIFSLSLSFLSYSNANDIAVQIITTEVDANFIPNAKELSIAEKERLNTYARRNPLGFLASNCHKISEDAIIKRAEEILAEKSFSEKLIVSLKKTPTSPVEQYEEALHYANFRAKQQQIAACARLAQYLEERKESFIAKKAVAIEEEYKKNIGE